MKQFIDIKADEKFKVVNLFLQNFFDGLGTSFFYAMGIFIFLGQSSHLDDLHYYPLVFIIGGVLILLTSPVYAKVESRARTDYLIYGLGIFVILLVIVSYFIIKAGISLTTGIALLTLYQLIYYLRQTQFWGLSALSFNVLQSKRLFSVVSAGDLPAKFLGYSVIFKLLETGVLVPENLVYFSITAYLISFFFLNRVFKSDHHLKHSSHDHFKSGVKEIPFFGNKLIRSMSFVAFFIMVVVFIVDYSFTKVVMFKINNEDVDMYVLVSTVLYVSYGIASLLKLFVSGKVFQKLGIKWTTLMTPLLMLLLIVFTLFLTLFVDDPNWYYVRMFIFLYISFLVFRDVIGKPVFLTLFQPLSKKMRLKGHNVVKGFAEPLGMIVSGSFLLLYYGYFEEYKLGLFAMALVVPLIFWLFSAVNVQKTYNATLHNVINLRMLSGKSYLLIDEKAKKELLDFLKSENEIEVLFALNQLKQYNEPPETFIHLLVNKSIVIQLAAWEILAELDGDEFLKIVSQFLLDETPLEVKKRVYFLMAKSSGPNSAAANFLSQDNPEVTENILLGWKENFDDEIPDEAEELIEKYLDSSEKEKYYSGLRLQKAVPSELGRASIIKSLGAKNPEEIKNAIQGAFGFMDRLIVKRLFQLMNNTDYSRLIKKEFVKMGDAAIPFIKPYFKDNDNPVSYKFIHVLCQIDTKHAVMKLVGMMEYKTPDLRKLIFDNLNDKETDHLVAYPQVLLDELEREIILAQKILPYSHVIEASYLKAEVEAIRRRIFAIIGLMYPQSIVKTIEEGYFSKNPDHIANSLETLVQVVKPEQYNKLQPVLESSDFFGQITITKEHALNLLDNHQQLNKWTVSSIILQYGYRPEHLKSLKARNSQIINEILNKDDMDSTDGLRILERVVMLKKTSLFANTPDNVLVEIAGLVKGERYEPGTTLFKKGELGNCMYIIYSGKVKIHDGLSELAIFGQNDFFGDLSMLDTEPRSASATTETETLLLRLDQQAIYELMDDRVEVAKGIISVLCERIRNLNVKYVGSAEESGQS